MTHWNALSVAVWPAIYALRKGYLMNSQILVPLHALIHDELLPLADKLVPGQSAAEKKAWVLGLAKQGLEHLPWAKLGEVGPALKGLVESDGFLGLIYDLGFTALQAA